MARKSLSLVKTEHNALVADVVPLIEAGRAAAARSVNSVMTTTYWHVGRVIVEREQRGARRAEYGAAVLERLAETLTGRFGRGFSQRNIEQMRALYLAWPIPQTASAILPPRKVQTLSALSSARSFARYALDGLSSKILAAESRTKLPREKVLVAEIEKTRRLLAQRTGGR